LHALAKHTSSLDTRKKVEALAAAYGELVVAVRLSVLDVLERHPDIDLPFTVYLQMLPSMRIRQYSISSSPLWNAMRITLTISVVQAPALAGAEEFLGVGSCYLAGYVNLLSCPRSPGI
jgi:cytochrome P450/NADPH-cytochrome P450 reductase